MLKHDKAFKLLHSRFENELRFNPNRISYDCSLYTYLEMIDRINLNINTRIKWVKRYKNNFNEIKYHVGEIRRLRNTKNTLCNMCRDLLIR